MREILERKIIGLIMKIENAKTYEDGKEAIMGGKINKHLKAIKPIDEVSYEELNTRYMKAVTVNSQKK